MNQNEKILILQREDIPWFWLPPFGAVPLSKETLLQRAAHWPLIFKPRSQMEQNARFKQVIPYLILQDEAGAVLCYRRKGSEQRLHDLYSAGIGGHISEGPDRTDDFWQTVQNGLRRELQEETGLLLDESRLRFYGIINEERTRVGRVHWGLVFLAQISGAQKEKLKASAELDDNAFCHPQTFLQHRTHEYWSALALELILKDGE